MTMCKECGEEHENDLLCMKCKCCLLTNGTFFYEDDAGMQYIQCTKCQQICAVDPSSFPDSIFVEDMPPNPSPAELEKTFDQEWGTDSEGEFPLDPPPKQIDPEERYRIWLKHLEKRKYDL